MICNTRTRHTAAGARARCVPHRGEHAYKLNVQARESINASLGEGAVHTGF